MFDKRNRWIITAIMAVAAFAFAGITIILPLTGAFQNPQTTAASPSAQADLEAQARGYELVLQREPNNETALRGLLEIRFQQQNKEAIIPLLEKLATLHPDQPDYSVLLAQMKQEAGDREGAAQAYRSVLETRPGDINALKGLSQLLLEEQRPQSAIGLLEDTLKKADEVNQVQPGSIDVNSVQVLLAEVYFQVGQADQAIALFDQVIQNNPQDFRPVLGKAMVLQAQGRNDEAQPLFASAAALAPDQYKDQINQLAASPSPSASPSSEAEVSPEPDTAVSPVPESPAPEANPEPTPAGQ
ncbi:MAG: tetratricopeptide repeat protein [Cyanobacteria bacterium CRU_2_1]|nr:tetratricopeptide repeat protein [Cyanobacteria bacterium RU_5_0]NJR62885.1 tetratricopeptide repeat protein [Cyanobacteria bacterium CRU_2_1]